MPNYDNDNHHGSPWYKFRDNTIKIVVKEGITATGNYAFESSSNLITVELPKSLIAIGDRTFHDCNRLAVIDIPDGVIKVGAYSFYNCVSLHSIVLPKGINVIERGAFQYCRGLESIDIPDEVVNIEYEAFYGCHGLLSVILPDGLKSIGDNAFYGCLNLPSITLPKGLAWIGDNAFAACESLASITIPAGVTTIGHWAFGSCVELNTVNIASSAAALGYLAFANCSNLKDMTVSWIRPPKDPNDFFYQVDLSKATLHVPKGRKAAYAKADYWKNFGTIVEDADNPSQPQPQPGESEWPSNITNDDGADYYVSSIAPATFVQPVSGDTPCPNGNFTAYGRNNLVAGAVVETGGTVCIVIKPVNNTGKFTKAGTAYIKQSDVCGTPLAEATYAVGDKQVVLRLKPNFTYGSRTYVPMIKTAAGGERFYTRPITITCKAKVGYIDDPALSMHPRITTAGTSIEARGDMFSRGATVKLQFSGPTDITATDITTDATGHFAYSFTLPATAKSGYYTVTAIEPSTNRTKTSRFQVTPAEDPSTPTPTTKSALELIAPIGSQTIYSGENLDLSWKDAVNLEADRKNGGRKYKIEASIDGGPWQFITDVTDNTVHSDGETVTYSEQYDPEHKSALRSALEGHALRSGRTDFTFKLKVIKDISAAAVGSAAATANTIVTELMNWKTVQKHTYNPVFLEWDRTDDPDNTPSRMGVKGVAADGVARIRMEYSRDKLDNRDKEVTSIRVTLSDDRNSTATNILGKIMVCSEEGVGTYQAAKNADEAFATIAETSIRHKDGKFRFWYVAPEDFSRGGQDDDAGKRIVYVDFKVTYANGETKTVRREIEIVRPPLMLVHGLNGDAGTWKDFALRTKKIKYKKDDRFIVATAPDMQG